MADNEYGPKYVCNLPPEVKAKAKKELNETDKDRPKKIKQLREKVLAHPGLNCPKDDLFLLRFLRARKFDVERAYKLLINYYTIKVKYEEHLGNLKPSTVEHVLDAGISMMLPMRDKEGRRVWFYRPGRWDHKKYPIMDLVRANMIAMEQVVQDEVTQVNGVIAIADFTGMSLGHVGKFDRTYAKVTFEMLQDSFPMRFKGMNMCNEALVVTYVMPIVKMFMSKKFSERMKFHGEDRKALHKIFGAAILPEELGGILGSADDIGKNWKDILMKEEGYFENLLQYNIDIPRDIFKNQRDESQVNEVVGTFRKLDV